MNGSKFVVVFLGGCVIAAVIAVMILARAFESRPQLNIPDVSLKRYNPKIYDFNEKLRGPLESRIDLATVPQKTEAEQKCQAHFSELLKGDYSANIDQLVAALQKDSCFENATFTTGSFNKKRVIELCLKDLSAPDCQQAAIFFRAKLLDHITLLTPLHDLTEQQLIVKFLAQFDAQNSDMNRKIDSEKMKLIAEEMLKRNPADPQYQDAFLQSEMIPFLNGLDQVTASDFSPEFDQLLNEKLQERPYDEKLQEYLFVRQMSLSQDEKRALILKVQNENPDSSIAAYGLSSLYFKSGDLENARVMLDRAIVLNPDSTRYRETRRRLNAGETSDIYTIRLTWGVNQ